MKYSIISSLYDEKTRKFVDKRIQVPPQDSIAEPSVKDDSPEMVIEEAPAPTHRVEVIEGVEHLITPEGRKFVIWGLLERNS